MYPTGWEGAGGLTACVICGGRGLADALLNLMLFLPLGSALAFYGLSGYRPYLFAALLSSCIESAQIFLPGRDPSLGDVLFNTLGAGIGFVVVRSVGWWLRPKARDATRLSLAATIAAVGLFAATGLLLEPSLPHSTYYGQWTPNLGHLEWYRGRVLRATLGPLEIIKRRLPDSESVRSTLLAGAPLRVRGVAGPPIPALGPLLSIYDDRHREIILLGPDRDDLVFRYRTRATSLRLDAPDLRVIGAMQSLAPGDTMQVGVWRDPQGYCLAVNGTRSCGLGFSVGSGWALLLYPEHLPAWLKTLLNVAWVAGLLFPLGFWARGRSGWALAAVALLAGLVVVPAVTGLRPTPPGEYVGGVVGLLLGVSLQMFARSRARF